MVDLGHVSVEGRLLDCVVYWRSIGAPKFILDVIIVGDKIPFITLRSHLSPRRSQNNSSPLGQRSFVTEAIAKLIRNNRVEEIVGIQDIVNPLSVSLQRKNKRLFLDLRH